MITFEDLAASDVPDVALGAALIARDAYANLDVDKLLARFDELAAPLVSSDLGSKNARDVAEAISHHLYETLGFSGNEADYYDPRNSLISDVLERRSGIPISLALVYCEVARRAGVRAEGVAFPGHFLVRVFGAADPPKAGGAGSDVHSEVLVDPFFRGRILDDAALSTLLERVAGQASVKDARVTAEMTAAATPRAFLTRWLLNLRGVYLTRGDLSRALLAVDRLVSLNPNDRGMIRDRGLLAARLGVTAQARDDLSRALALDPTSEELRSELAKLDAKPTSSN
jgi:regulator of sirC expression with transglutaminase-like and TPR domain